MRARAIRGGGKRKLKLSCAVVALSGVLSGCAEFEISDSELQRISKALETSLSRPSCQAKPDSAPTKKTIDIAFVEQKPGVWCPVGPVETCPQVYQKLGVQWRSVRLNDDGIWEPFSTGFTVYLTPFRGDSFRAVKNGVTGFQPLDPEAPPGVYKYTVWDSPTGHTGPLCEPLDPNFFVNR